MNGQAILNRAGPILFGPHWKGEFAATFDIAPRALNRMAKGKQPVPDGLLADIETALHDHGNALDELLAEFVDRV